MSGYDDYSTSRSHRSSRTREPEYVETGETYVRRGQPSHDLVLRPRNDRYDDDEYEPDSYHATREYGPPGPLRRARSAGRHRRDSYYDDDYYSDHGPRSRRRRGSYYDDDYSDYDRHRGRRKSKVEGLLEDLGLGGVAAAAVKKVRSISRPRRHSSSSSERSYGRRRGSRSRSRGARKKWKQAATAAVMTGVVEAVLSRNEPGKWTGPKGQRVATAALGAAGIDSLLDRDPDRKEKRHVVESVIGGIVGNRLVNGPRERSSSRGRSKSRTRSISERIRSRSRSILGRKSSLSRSRSRSRGRSSSRGPGLKGVAALGAAAAAGKAIFDRVRSKSRGRTRRSASVSSSNSDVPTRRQRYQGGPDYAGTRSGPTDTMSGGRGTSRSSSLSSTDLEERHRKMRGKELLTAALASVATIHAAHGVYSSMVASDKRRKLVKEGEMSPDEARKIKSKNMLQDAAAVGIAALGIKSAFGEWKEMKESRHEKHELEAQRRRRRKERERRKREGSERAMMMQPPLGGVGPYQQQNAMANTSPFNAGPAYHDGNPYTGYGSGFPPPPVGPPPPPNEYR